MFVKNACNTLEISTCVCSNRMVTWPLKDLFESGIINPDMILLFKKWGTCWLDSLLS